MRKNEDDADGGLEGLHVLAALGFGYIFISATLKEGAPMDPFAWWWDTILSIFMIGIGVWGAVFTQRAIDYNAKGFKKYYDMTHVSLFKMQAEGMQKPYMFLFSRLMGIMFVVIGALALFQNLHAINPKPFVCPDISFDDRQWESFTVDEQKCIREEKEIRQKQAEQRIETEARSWPRYTNRELGVSFAYPPIGSADKLEFFQAGDVLFVASASSSLFAHRSELNIPDNKKILAMARSIRASSTNNYGYWAIWIKDVDSNDRENSLGKMYDDYYDRGSTSGCRFGSLEKSTSDGIFNVVIAPVSLGPTPDEYGPESSCWINWIYYFKYSRDFNRAAMWDVGQEAQFLLSSLDEVDCGYDYECSADYYMAKSFQFLKPAENENRDSDLISTTIGR